MIFSIPLNDIQKTIAGNFLYGSNYNAKNYYNVIKHIKKHLPTKNEGFERYCSVKLMAGMIRRSQYNFKHKESVFEEANEWIATHLDQLARHAFK